MLYSLSVSSSRGRIEYWQNSLLEGTNPAMD